MHGRAISIIPISLLGFPNRDTLLHELGFQNWTLRATSLLVSVSFSIWITFFSILSLKLEILFHLLSHSTPLTVP